VEQRTNHGDLAVERLIAQYVDKPVITALVRTFGERAQMTEDVLWDLLNQRALETAYGAQLDVLGGILNESRRGRDDEAYRTRLRVRIALTRSSGTATELQHITRLLVPDRTANPRIESRDEPPAEMTLQVQGAFPMELDPQDLLNVLLEAKSAAVRIVLQWQECTDDEVFQFDDGPGWDQGKWSNSIG
jgi:hypothetical protein